MPTSIQIHIARAALVIAVACLLGTVALTITKLSAPAPPAEAPAAARQVRGPAPGEH